MTAPAEDRHIQRAVRFVVANGARLGEEIKLAQLLADTEAAERERSAALQARLDLLTKAVNESANDCTDECTSLGHREGCKTFDAAAMLVALRGRVAELERERDRLQGFVDEDEALATAVRENLPECTCDADGNLGSEVERIEFAGGEIERLERERDALRSEVERLRAEKDGAYRERNELAIALATMFGGRLVPHEGEPFEEGWNNVLIFDLPTGQVSFHIHASQLANVMSCPLIATTGGRGWDGHTNEEKWERFARFSTRPAAPWSAQEAPDAT